MPEKAPSLIYAFFFNKTGSNPPEKPSPWVAGVHEKWQLIYYYSYERHASETGERFRSLDRIRKFAEETFVEIPADHYESISVIHDDAGHMAVHWYGGAFGTKETVSPELFALFIGDMVVSARACFDANLFHSSMYDGYKSNLGHMIKTLGGLMPDDFGFRLRGNRLTDQDRNEWFRVVSDHLMKQSAIYLERAGKGSRELIHGFGADSYVGLHDYYVFSKSVWI